MVSEQVVGSPLFERSGVIASFDVFLQVVGVTRFKKSNW
jgi:hypothetical protein